MRRLATIVGVLVTAGLALLGYVAISPPRAVFSLNVLDDKGQGIAGARVSVLSTRSFFGLESASALDGETARDGRATFDDVALGQLHVQVEQPGFDDYTISYTFQGEGGAEVRLRRTPGASLPKGIDVRVADVDGKAVPKSVVVVSGERYGRPFNFQNETDDRGRALFPFVSPGLIDLSIRKSGYADYDLSHVVREDDKLDVRLVE